MQEWNGDSELFDLMRSTLYSPVLGDLLDQFGVFHAFLPQPIQPLLPDMKLAGRAMPVLQADVYGKQEAPFGRMAEALDALRPHEVYISTGTMFRCANWGEILTATAKARKAAGAVVNGFHRDTPKVLEQQWPVFSRGAYGQDSAPRMKVLDYRCPIEIEGVWIEPGDIVFGDVDGVLVIPQRLEVDVVAGALEKARAEKSVRKAIENGMSCTDAFRKYGVL